MSAAGRVPLTAIRSEERACPREEIDAERVAEFRALFEAEGLDALPPLELVPDHTAGGYVLGDGWHRLAALADLEVQEVPAVLFVPPPGGDPVDYAYEHALSRSTRSSKPLSRAEKQAAIRRLIIERPTASDREIARLVGVDHKTVGRVRRWGTSPAAEPAARRMPTPEEAARRLLSSFEKVHEARGLGFADWLRGGDRTAERLAWVLADVYGDSAADRARMFIGWLEESATFLDEEHSQW